MRFWFYTLRAAWRSAMGRWYVWRDAPTDVVREAAVLWYHARKKPREEGTDVVAQAYAEYQLRKRKEKK